MDNQGFEQHSFEWHHSTRIRGSSHIKWRVRRTMQCNGGRIANRVKSHISEIRKLYSKKQILNTSLI